MKVFNSYKFYAWVILTLLLSQQGFSQSEMVIPPSNRSTVNLEKNLLFYADSRYTVTQSGATSLPLPNLFDGNYQPNYSGPIPDGSSYVIKIENLPNYHVQAGAWIGWTTRYYSPVKFKIEVFDSYSYNPTYNTWITVADVDNNHNGSYIVALPQCAPSAVRFTFYQGEGPGGTIGLSELFLIHPEATQVYDGLLVHYDHNGNVGIGTTDTHGYQLAVNGTIHSKEVLVDLNNWPDYVFKKDYALMPLSEIKNYIDQNYHLPEIPSAVEVEKDGINLGEMNKVLLKKVEELTLYLIEKDKQINDLKISQGEQIKKLQTQVQYLTNKASQ